MMKNLTKILKEKNHYPLKKSGKFEVFPKVRSYKKS